MTFFAIHKDLTSLCVVKISCEVYVDKIYQIIFTQCVYFHEALENKYEKFNENKKVFFLWKYLI